METKRKQGKSYENAREKCIESSQQAHAGRGVWSSRARVLRVGQRAGCAVAQPVEVVLVAAEGLRRRLRLERAEALVDHLPDDLVGLPHLVVAAAPGATVLVIRHDPHAVFLKQALSHSTLGILWRGLRTVFLSRTSTSGVPSPRRPPPYKCRGMVGLRPAASALPRACSAKRESGVRLQGQSKTTVAGLVETAGSKENTS